MQRRKGAENRREVLKAYENGLHILHIRGLELKEKNCFGMLLTCGKMLSGRRYG